ncbi:hypothetical protein LEP3755_64330 (plasmid) [Leptolyngbya sp. NIES-3755]|nr:hypothetical protein LEP3755_64330 [Leptolyngbya sp. NIES-3755]
MCTSLSAASRSISSFADSKPSIALADIVGLTVATIVPDCYSMLLLQIFWADKKEIYAAQVAILRVSGQIPQSKLSDDRTSSLAIDFSRQSAGKRRTEIRSIAESGDDVEGFEFVQPSFG